MAYHDPNMRLHRSSEGQIIAGVCSGLSETYKMDVSLIRIIFIILLFTTIGFWIYIALWIVLPKDIDLNR